MKRILFAAAMMVGITVSAGAQIIRPTSVYRPGAYTSISAGWVTQQAICDPESDACWTFGDGAQYRASIELPLGMATTFGLSYSHANLPLQWADTPPNSANCGGGVCPANAEMHQVLGLLHLGGSGMVTQLIDVSAGATRFANFKSTNGTPLGPGRPVTDFSFAVAIGIGFNLNRALQFTLQQEYGLVIHKRVPGSTTRGTQQRTLRAGLRLGL